MRLRYKELVIRVFFSLFLLLTSTQGFAVITVTYDNKSSSSNTSVSSLTWSHTTGTGSDRILIVGVAVQGVNINSVTYNGTNLTRLATKTNTVKVEMWYLVAPTNGAHNVVVTLSGNCGLSGVTGGAQSFYNVDPTTPFGTTGTASGNRSTASATVSSAVNEIVVDAVATSFFGLTIGGGQTLGFNQAPFISGAGSRATGAASVTMDWSIALSDDWATIAVPIKPAAVLPIKLYSFNAECEGEKVDIFWTTISEINNSYFTIEKSVDGEFFEQLTTVQGGGNSSIQRK